MLYSMLRAHLVNRGYDVRSTKALGDDLAAMYALKEGRMYFIALQDTDMGYYPKSTYGLHTAGHDRSGLSAEEILEIIP
jgi:hypothetical protein